MSDLDNVEIDEADEGEGLGLSRNYFLSKALGGVAKKSTSKISDIQPVDEQELRSALAALEPKHENEVHALHNRYKENYPKWFFDIRCGFGLLMYGFGSKKQLIEDFASTALTEYSVLVIKGYLLSVNLKQVLTVLAELWYEQIKQSKSNKQIQLPFSSRSTDDLLEFLDESPEEGDSFVCLVVHNIDGPALRDPENQEFLAQIAACSNVRIIASIDHINAPLLWDKKMVHKQFNWCWYHVPTFAQYKVENTSMPLVLANRTTDQTAKTAIIVLQSLTPNAQAVFKILANYQLSRPKDEGMPYDDLYSSSRERFLVSSQVTLNSHLTEFKDHDLVKSRRNKDGQDCLYIPLSPDELGKVVLEIN